MNTIEKLTKILEYLRGPVVIGLLVALLALQLFPERLSERGIISNLTPPNDNSTRTVITSYAEAVKKASPSVVNIYTRKELAPQRRHPLLDDPRYRRFFNSSDAPQQKRMQSALGSGVIVSKEGYIITNFHVINGADEIVIALQDGRQAHAKVIGESREYDMAVLRIDLDKLIPISIGNPDQAQVGDVVLAIGNPFGVGQTVTQGIISGTRRKDLNISLFENFIQTDAAINPGNSGGALVDAHGNLLGINIANLEQTTSGSANGIGFAIPADKAIQTLQDIVEYGRVLKGWLGVGARDISAEIALAQKLKSIQGIWITDVFLNGPADQAGLKAGDVIIGINNQIVNDIATGWKEVAGARPGDKVVIDVIRNNENLRLEATLGVEPSA